MRRTEETRKIVFKRRTTVVGGRGSTGIGGNVYPKKDQFYFMIKLHLSFEIQ